MSVMLAQSRQGAKLLGVFASLREIGEMAEGGLFARKNYKF